MGQLRNITIVSKECIILFLFVFCVVIVCYADPSSSISENELIRLWDEAKTDSLLLVYRPFAASNPAHPVTKFLEAALERDGQKAAQEYEAIIEQSDHAKVIPRAMLRLAQYYHAVNNQIAATNWERRLEMEYPDYQLPKYQPVSSRETVQPYALQLGAYQYIENAQDMVEKASKYGLSSQIVRKHIRGRLLYLVWAGQFATKNAAEETGQQLKSEHLMDYHVIARSQE